MEITFLIGNGFDIGLGMKTQYSQFIPIYIKNNTDNRKVLKDFSEELKENIDKWSYFEKQIGEYTLQFSENNKFDLIEQLEDFEKSFVRYLSEEEEKLEFIDTSKIGGFFQEKILKFYLTLPAKSINSISGVFGRYKSSPHHYNFITFNYTNALEKCLETIPNKIISKRGAISDTIGKIVHVHGLCDNLPLMGLNDNEQIKNQELAKDEAFSKYLIKPELNKLNRTNNDSEALNLINRSQIICIYGMSLGETDSFWWNKIISWLNLSTDRHLVVFEYDQHFKKDTQFAFIKKMDYLIEKLNYYNQNPKIKIESLRERIHLSVEDIFAYHLIIEEEISKSKLEAKEELVGSV